jgi:glutamate-1-semialdehyde 2,1-aminomutase
MFFKTGSECAHIALRTALAATHRKTVVSLGYHGWICPFGQSDLDCRGVRLLTPGWSLDEAMLAVREAGADLAGIFVSPSPLMIEPEFYQALNAEAHRVGALFMMDEVKSGFRWAFPCLSSAFGLRPDIVLFAKAVTNGFPLAIMGGTNRFLSDPDLISIYSTYASENVSLFAARYCLSELANGAYARFQRAAHRFHDCLRPLLEGMGCRVKGVPTFFRVELPGSVDWGVFADGLARRAILYHPKDEVLLSAAHDDPQLLESLFEAFRSVGQEMLS